jgi:LacI family transcriptional regulator
MNDNTNVSAVVTMAGLRFFLDLQVKIFVLRLIISFHALLSRNQFITRAIWGVFELIDRERPMSVKSLKAGSSKRNKPPTMVAVAEHAGVSRAAVYAVLSGDSEKHNIGVGDEKRERILRSAHELGYVRNQAARALVSGKTHSIGVLVQSLRTRFFTDFFTVLDDTCFADGYAVSISSSDFDIAREARHLEMMLSHRVDGLVLAWCDPPNNIELLERIRKCGIPVILLGSEHLDLNFPLVSFRATEIVRLMAEQFITLRHERVAFLGAWDAMDNSRSMHRYRMDHFVDIWLKMTGNHALRLTTSDTDYGGIAVAEKIAAMPAEKRPTAVACSTDTLALGLLHGLLSKGLDVPGDVSVLGCDDIPEARQHVVPLSTVRLPTDQLAQAAWKMLGATLHGDDTLSDNPRVLIKPQMIVRASTRDLSGQ